MKLPKLLGSVQPFISGIAVVVTTALLLIAIYFTNLDVQWVAFLAGVLMAAALAVVSRAARAEVSAASRGEKLSVTREQLAQEMVRRQTLEGQVAEAHSQLRMIENLPVLVAFIDAEGVYRYHNDAFRRWLDLPRHRIEGQHMRNVLGKAAYAAVEAEVAKAAKGETVRYERTQKMANSAVYRMHVQYIPVFGERSKFNGFFAVMSDITDRGDLHAAARAEVPTGMRAAPAASALSNTPVSAHPGSAPTAGPQESFGDSVARQVTGWSDARERIIAAIERNEFTLFCQLITPLDPAAGKVHHYEILIRLLEEEDNLIPPGAFFPLAEEHGLLPRLDRWVVDNVLAWASRHAMQDAGARTFFLNIATDTMSDPDFPEHVANEVKKRRLPGSILCFEIAHGDLFTNGGDIGGFVRQIKQAGCRIALSGFGRDRVSVDLLKTLPLDFLKIDGAIVLQAGKDPMGLSRIAAIHRLANGLGIATVAEMVESDDVMAKLRELKVDYAQGFGISRPRPLAEIAAPDQQASGAQTPGTRAPAANR